MKKKYFGFGSLVILLASLVLTACEHVSREESASLVASMQNQPPVLRLEKGKPVMTKDGQWIPLQDEIWHSDARFRLLEQQVIDLRFALDAKH